MDRKKVSIMLEEGTFSQIFSIKNFVRRVSDRSRRARARSSRVNLVDTTRESRVKPKVTRAWFYSNKSALLFASSECAYFCDSESGLCLL